MATNAPATAAEVGAPTAPGFFTSSLPSAAVSTFARQLAVLLDAGIPMVRALKILGRRSGGSGMKSLVEKVTADVEAGGSFSTALATHGPGLPGVVVPLARAGEKAGELSANLRYLADNLDHDEKVRTKVTEAMIFPGFTLVVGGLVFLFILTVVAPLFQQIMADIPNLELPLITRILFRTADAMSSWLMRGVLLVLIGAFAFALWRGARMRNYLLDFMKLRIPYIGRMVTIGAMGRFAKTLSALLRTGVPVLESLRLSRATVDNLAIEEAIIAMEKSVESGGRMSAPLEEHWFIPELARDMIIIGEESGSMAEMLDNLAEVFRTDLDRMQGKVVALIQPVLTIVLGGVALTVLLAMFIPYFSILTQGTMR